MQKKIGWLVVSCLMALSLLLASCAPAVTEEEEVTEEAVTEEAVTEEAVAPTPTPTPPAPVAAPQEPVYTVLDPRSYEPEVECQGLTPRLDTLEGKTVGIINMGGAGAEIMETIGPALEAAVPGCTTVYRQMGHGPGAMMGVGDLMESCDAIILGHNY